MKEGSFVLFCSYEIHQTRMLQIMFLVSLESSQRGGVHGLCSMTFGIAVQKFLNTKCFLHWKLNQIVVENFGGIGMCKISWGRGNTWANGTGHTSCTLGFNLHLTLVFCYCFQYGQNNYFGHMKVISLSMVPTQKKGDKKIWSWKDHMGENMYQPIHIGKIVEETCFTNFHIEKIISCVVMLIIARILLVMFTQNMWAQLVWRFMEMWI
jgi:hypothetical protein